MTNSTEESEEGFSWVQLIFGIPVIILMFYAVLFGFFWRALFYGFTAGTEMFDNLFETQASKMRKAEQRKAKK